MTIIHALQIQILHIWIQNLQTNSWIIPTTRRHKLLNSQCIQHIPKILISIIIRILISQNNRTQRPIHISSLQIMSIKRTPL